MKKIFGIATTLLLTAALAACGTGSNSGSSDSSAAEGESTKLVIPSCGNFRTSQTFTSRRRH